jgi:signal recognition particle subunit SEC65
LATHADTQKSSWVLVDATVFAAFAGLTEDVWTRLVGGFLHQGSGGAARIKSVKLTSSANTSLLKVAVAPTASPGRGRAVTRNVLLSEFRNGNITELLLPLPVVRALMREKRYPRNLVLRKSQLSHEQALALDRLLATAESYLQQSHTER